MSTNNTNNIETITWGICQSDLLVRSWILSALSDLRRNPWLFTYIYAQLPKDELTKNDYGNNTLQRAREWFLKTEIPVFLNTHVNAPKFPCIVLELVSSVEADRTVSNTHYQPYEAVDIKWDDLCPRFAPAAYVAATGAITLPSSVLDVLYPVVGMILLDSNDVEHPILEISSDGTTVFVAPCQADFMKSVIRGAKPTYIAELESIEMKETIQIGCFVDSENEHCLFLHTIILFLYYRYSEMLLEARGVEKTALSSSAFASGALKLFEQSQTFYSRYMTLTGFVRHYYPKSILPAIQNVTADPTIESTNPLDLTEIDWNAESF
jgi:hypothetical protein